MAPQLIRIGLIGCGNYCSNTHAPFLAIDKNISIQAISECIYPQELLLRQRQFSIPYAFIHFEEMIKELEFEGVVISTPHTQHYRQAKACLEHGINVLVDKPPVCSSYEIEELAQLAKDAGLNYIVAVPRRYNPIYIRLRNEISQDVFGDLKFVDIHYGRSKSEEFQTSWRNQPDLSGGGVIQDAGYHILDSLLWITGRRILTVSGSLQSNGMNVETSSALSLALSGNVLADLRIHSEMPLPIVEERIGFYGTKMAVMYQYMRLPDGTSTSQLTRMSNKFHTIEDVARDKSSDFAPADDLVKAIRGQRLNISTAASSISTVKAIEMIYASTNNQSYDPRNFGSTNY